MADTALQAVRQRLRIAIQKNGRLAEPARALLSACGLAWREQRDQLFCQAEDAPFDLLLVRDDDIPRLLAEGLCELGIVGRNVLGEQCARVRELGGAPAAIELRALGFGACRLALAVPDAQPTATTNRCTGATRRTGPTTTPSRPRPRTRRPTPRRRIQTACCSGRRAAGACASVPSPMSS